MSIREKECLENVTNVHELIQWINTLPEDSIMSSFVIDRNVNMKLYAQMLKTPDHIKGLWVFAFDDENNNPYITILFVEENLGAGTLDLTFIPLNVILRFWKDNEIDKYHDYYKLILYDADDYLKAAEKGEHCLMHHIEKMIIKNRDLLNMINEWFFHDLSLKSFSGPYKHSHVCSK